MVVDIHLNWLINYIKINKINKFIEIGVAKGGVLALVSKYSKDTQIYGLDSWEGMPLITDNDQQEYKRYEGIIWSKIEDVEETFSIIKASTKNLNLIKGYLENTIPKNLDKLNSIDILRLDVDWYEGTIFYLNYLYDKVKNNGLIIIDDYYFNTGCKKAVHDFFREKNINPKIHDHNVNFIAPVWFYK